VIEKAGLIPCRGVVIEKGFFSMSWGFPWIREMKLPQFRSLSEIDFLERKMSHPRLSFAPKLLIPGERDYHSDRLSGWRVLLAGCAPAGSPRLNLRRRLQAVLSGASRAGVRSSVHVESQMHV
jgi:hypothetical protein